MNEFEQDEGRISAVVSITRFEVFATTRDECIQLLDAVGNNFLDFVGGQPWMMAVDEIERVQAKSSGTPVLADDQGFNYHGARGYIFQGPIKRELALSDSFNPGNEPQKVSA